MHDNCVVCAVGNGELEHDPAGHPIVDYHQWDSVPTSEPCPRNTGGYCQDCEDVRLSLFSQEEDDYDEPGIDRQWEQTWWANRGAQGWGL